MEPRNESRIAQAARWLLEAHAQRAPFSAFPPELEPATLDEAYAVQDAFVALRAEQRGAVAGYKIALATQEMRRFAGLDEPLGGVIHEGGIQRSPASVRAADYVRLIVEFEIAVEMAGDLPAADAPFTRERVKQAVGAVMPALELADDRSADYKALPKHPLALVADNTWNEGVVLGQPVTDWQGMDLASVRGIAYVNGKPVGQGQGADAMGHPFDAVAWVANHLAASGRGLLRRDVVITGSLVASQAVKAGDLVKFSVGGLGEVDLRVE
jgi:2-keto-4-pentenoate hydratase